MVTLIFSHPLTPNGSFLVLNSGWLYRVLPRLARAFPVLNPSLLGWLCIEQGLLCQVFWASLSCCSTRSSFADTLLSFEMLLLLLCPSSPSWPSIDRCCYLCGKLLFSCWWLLLQLVLLIWCHRWVWIAFLLSRSLRWFYMPTRHLAVPPAMHLLPLPIELWWSSTVFDSSLLSVCWLTDVLEKKTGSWLLVPSKSFWSLDYRTSVCFLILSSFVFWSCKLCFSIQCFGSLPPW